MAGIAKRQNLAFSDENLTGERRNYISVLQKKKTILIMETSMLTLIKEYQLIVLT